MEFLKLTTAQAISKAVERAFLEPIKCIQMSSDFKSFCENVSVTVNTIVAERISSHDIYSHECSDFLFTTFTQYKNYGGVMNQTLSAIKSLSDELTSVKQELSGELTSVKQELSGEITSVKQELSGEITSVKQSMSELPDQIYDRIHSSNSDKIEIIRKISQPVVICDSHLTTHFLVNGDKIFGLTVAHADCKQAPYPKWLVPCPGLDIAIMVDCPTESVSVMNITGRVVSAKMGDSASLFGFIESGSQERASIGNLVGVYGVERKGEHFSSLVVEHPDSWIYQGDIFAGMSGSCVLNGNGTSSCILFLLL